jgi:hypothetical protein
MKPHPTEPALRRSRAVYPRGHGNAAAKPGTPLKSQIRIDSDNGSEFINDHLLRPCTEQEITFTRPVRGVRTTAHT